MEGAPDERRDVGVTVTMTCALSQTFCNFA